MQPSSVESQTATDVRLAHLLAHSGKNAIIEEAVGWHQIFRALVERFLPHTIYASRKFPPAHHWRNQIRKITWQPRAAAASGKGEQAPVEDLSVDTPKDEYYYEMAEFIDMIEAGKRESVINSHQNSLTTIEIIDEVRHQLGVVYPADSLK